MIKIDIEKALSIISHWYQKNCNGDWEQFFGVTIESCDNPGWRLRINDPNIHDHPRLSLLKNYRSQLDRAEVFDFTINEGSVDIFSNKLDHVVRAAACVLALH